MTLQADVQKLVDEVAANKDGVKAALDGLAVEATQIADLKAQVDALTKQIGTGIPIDAEDLTAIQSVVATLADTNTALQIAVPANTTPPQPAPAPAPPSTP